MALPTVPQTIASFMRSDVHNHPVDSGMGGVYRPFGTNNTGQRSGGRVATLETLYDFFINSVPDPAESYLGVANADILIDNHPDVKACMNLRSLSVSSLPWHIEPSHARGINPDVAQEIAEYVQDVFDEMPNVQNLYRMLEHAVLLGGQGVELVWDTKNGVELPVNFFPVHKSRFARDRMGNLALLTRSAPVYGEYVQAEVASLPNGDKVYYAPQGKFLYHIHQTGPGGSWANTLPEGFIYWGKGENIALWNLVQIDQFVTRFRVKWLERYGIPLAMLYYPQTDKNARSMLTTIANSIRNEGIATIPRIAGGGKDDFYDVEYKQAPGTGQDYFASLRETFIRPGIEKILLGGANLLQIGAGSYSASVDQRDAGSTIVFQYDAQNISQTLNQQLIPYIVRAKWPSCPEEFMPKHVMAPSERSDKVQDMTVIREAAALVPILKTEVYKKAGLEIPKDGEDEKNLVFIGSNREMIGELDGFPSAMRKPDEGKILNGKKAPPIGGPSSEDLEILKDNKDPNNNQRIDSNV